MIESPVLDRFAARVRQQSIVSVLEDRFGEAPDEIVRGVEGIEDEQQLRRTLSAAVRSPDLAAFHRSSTAPDDR